MLVQRCLHRAGVQTNPHYGHPESSYPFSSISTSILSLTEMKSHEEELSKGKFSIAQFLTKPNAS